MLIDLYLGGTNKCVMDKIQIIRSIVLLIVQNTGK